MTGEEREEALKAAQARLLEMDPIITAANEAVKLQKKNTPLISSSAPAD